MKKSRYIGVEYIDSLINLKKPWKVSITFRNKRYSDVFETELEAVMAYNEVAEKWGMETNLIREVYYEHNGKYYTEKEWKEFEKG